MVTVDDRLTTAYVGLSADEKPTEGVRNGSSFVEMDTQKYFAYDAENQRWIELT